jgi:hypothetical protein
MREGRLTADLKVSETNAEEVMHKAAV